MLWIPGPTEVRRELLAECARAQISHRGSEMNALCGRIDPPLRSAFGLGAQSRASVAVHTTSGTGLMELGLRGVGARTLHLVNGAFSQRWFEVAQALGKEAVRLEAPLGETVAPERVAAELARRQPDALCLTANETSTGVFTPPSSLTAVLADFPEVLFLADVVSSFAGAPVDFDDARLDFALASSQKALSLPPGIAVCCASERFMTGAARLASRGSFYLDPLRVIEGHVTRQSIATPALPQYFALARQLEDITSTAATPAQAWRTRFEKHRRLRAQMLAWCDRHVLETLPRREHSSPTVTCVRSGPLDVERLVKELHQRGEVISNGYGELKSKTFRVGHMGDHGEADLARLLALMDELAATCRRAG